MKQTLNNLKLPAVILTAGSEVISISIAEALSKKNIPIILIALGIKSIIRDIAQVCIYHQITWPPTDENETVKDIINFMKQNNSCFGSIPLPVFPSEDSGLRFILENRDALKDIFHISTSNLKMCGLDKAEFFGFLNNTKSKSYLAETIIIDSPEDASSAIKILGEDAVFKPALKPLSMKLGDMDSKVITSNNGDNYSTVLKKLEKSWHISSRWVVQKRLNFIDRGELSWGGIRTKNNKLIGLAIIERWKQPRMGGTACWVQSVDDHEIYEQIKEILNDLDFYGIFEIPFLLNEKNQWNVLEFNPRSWLQIGLAEASGLPLIYLAYCDMLNLNADYEIVSIEHNINWVNPERLLISAISGENGSKLIALLNAIKVIYRAEFITVYKSRPIIIIYRWLGLMLYKGLNLIKKILYGH